MTMHRLSSKHCHHWLLSLWVTAEVTFPSILLWSTRPSPGQPGPLLVNPALSWSAQPSPGQPSPLLVSPALSWSAQPSPGQPGPLLVNPALSWSAQPFPGQPSKDKANTDCVYLPIHWCISYGSHITSRCIYWQ